ncbi:hypothetical protein TCAL_12280 [Tigriopus californicus]|uniref:Uncharacterized protein n=1 Tax=Tigriopus californicus TaxID=6832 RepID=A0A553PLP2_TIGCA|nr:hypothetical protein TCAL_12280 [Tigriopus californicus]|eukprot:TCALIF_12280-PA protein Name:"Protein of unknown function" AED:0.34 eAED:0.37 QI:0/0/0/0.5/1/1/2/0/507
MMQKHGKGSIFEELRLHRTKCSRIIERVLSPSLKEELKEDMVGARFSALADESNDISVDKNLCLVVIYFSMKTEKIEVAYLSLYQVIEATLFKVIETSLQDMDLQWTNCVGFGSDGASNMVGIHNSVWSRIEEKAPNCTLFKCICHSLALCVKIAFDTLPSNLGYILSEVSSWFSNSTLRRENYMALYDAIGDLDAEEGKITKAGSSLWCTLKQYFLTAEQLSDQSARMKARFIKEMLCDDNNYLFFIFLEPIVKEVERVNAFFQSSKADPEQMVKELDLLHRSIKIRVKDANGTNLSLSRVDFGGAFMTMLMSLVRERGPRGDALQQSVNQNVKTRAQTFMETLLIQLEARMPVSQQVFRGLSTLCSQKVLSQSGRATFLELPSRHLIQDVGLVEMQYRKIQLHIWQEESIFNGDLPQESESFWAKIRLYKLSDESHPYRELVDYALAALSVPVSNAIVERIFSHVTFVKNKNRSTLSLQMLDLIIRVRMHLRLKGICCTSLIVPL